MIMDHHRVPPFPDSMNTFSVFTTTPRNTSRRSSSCHQPGMNPLELGEDRRSSLCPTTTTIDLPHGHQGVGTTTPATISPRNFNVLSAPYLARSVYFREQMIQLLGLPEKERQCRLDVEHEEVDCFHCIAQARYQDYHNAVQAQVFREFRDKQLGEVASMVDAENEERKNIWINENFERGDQIFPFFREELAKMWLTFGQQVKLNLLFAEEHGRLEVGHEQTACFHSLEKAQDQDYRLAVQRTNELRMRRKLALLDLDFHEFATRLVLEEDQSAEFFLLDGAKLLNRRLSREREAEREAHQTTEIVLARVLEICERNDAEIEEHRDYHYLQRVYQTEHEILFKQQWERIVSDFNAWVTYFEQKLMLEESQRRREITKFRASHYQDALRRQQRHEEILLYLFEKFNEKESTERHHIAQTEMAKFQGLNRLFVSEKQLVAAKIAENLRKRVLESMMSTVGRERALELWALCESLAEENGILNKSNRNDNEQL